jgi:hypothetical protein
VDVAQTGGYFAGDHRLAASGLSVRVSSPTVESELRTLVDDATEQCPGCQAIRGQRRDAGGGPVRYVSANVGVSAP